MNWYYLEPVAWQARKRMIQIESSMMTELEHMVSLSNEVRFMYEESPHYEIGYVFAELMERYRKMADTLHRVNTHPDVIWLGIRYLSETQHFYLEVYHLVMMLHEIPAKWGHVEKFALLKKHVQENNYTDPAVDTPETEEQYYRNLRDERQRLAELRRLQRERQKQLELSQSADQLARLLQGQHIDLTEHPPDKTFTGVPQGMRPRKLKPSNWKLDYGWDTNYKWWE